jgi:hypothetical protein
MEVAMSNLRQSIRLGLGAAACAALLFAACVPPIAFHDGLPAWTPAAGRVEGGVGYQRLSSFGVDSVEILGYKYSPHANLNYFTPGVRLGIGRGSTTADVGLASAIIVGGGKAMLLAGPQVGVCVYRNGMSVAFRLDDYLFDARTGSDSDGRLSVGNWPQATVLVGNGYRARRVNFSAGLRGSLIAIGPVALVDYDLHAVDLRAELSYMLPTSILSVGQTALTAGLTVAAPTH